MSHELIFTILPFDPMAAPFNEVRLPIDPDDFTRQLQLQWPNSEIRVRKKETGIVIRLYILTEKQEIHNVLSFGENHSVLDVTGWPKSIAKEIILWYRQYVPIHFQLFLITPENNFTSEITANTTQEDIENMYPYFVSDD